MVALEPIRFTRYLGYIFVRLIVLREVFLPVTTGFAHHRSMNGAMWAIECELGCYLLLALAGVLGMSRRRWPILLISGEALLGSFIDGPRW